MQCPPPRPPELGTDDRDDLDTGFTQQGVGLGVPVVGEDDARLEGDRVVAAVPRWRSEA